jgi:dTDP-4-amino-4,6-dideoxygalactose transaminase
LEQIAFNQTARFGDELRYLEEALESGALAGDGAFGKLVQQRLSQMLAGKPTLLTPSCTAALEMCALLLNVGPGDEVIMPSYTFVSTANAFVLRGARIKFIDVRADTMNIDENQIEAAISDRTRAIVAVHYAGVGCEMSRILEIADHHRVAVVEDAAQALQATYKGQSLGTFGALATFSFHESKNITSGGEGGLLAINDLDLVERAEVIREKGTDRSRFTRGEVDKYSWRDIGSSQLAGELQAAHLYSQLQHADEIHAKRMALWQA